MTWFLIYQDGFKFIKMDSNLRLRLKGACYRLAYPENMFMTPLPPVSKVTNFQIILNSCEVL